MHLSVLNLVVCVCACVRACVRACACVCVCVWQAGLLQAWGAARGAAEPGAAEGDEPADGGGAPVTAGEDGAALARAVVAGAGAAQRCRVAASVADALGVVGLVAEEAAAAGGGVTALVTGSLYLVGDVLARTGARESLEAL
jgi:hypothetical protein